jgi:hypothetical protein
VAPKSSDIPKGPKVDGYTSYQEPAYQTGKLVNTGATGSAGRESFSGYDQSYSATDLSSKEVNRGWGSSETGYSADSQGRGRSSSAVGLSGGYSGGWTSSSAGASGFGGRSQSLTRSSDYVDQGYGDMNTDNTQYGSSANLASDKRSYSYAGGLDSGYGDSSAKDVYGYTSGQPSDSNLYGDESGQVADTWNYSTEQGIEAGSYGFGSAPDLGSESYGYGTALGSGDDRSYGHIPGLTLSDTSVYKSASQDSSEKQSYKSSKQAADKRAYGLSSGALSGQTSYGTASGFDYGSRAYNSASDVSSVSRNYEGSSELVSAGHDSRSAKDQSYDNWYGVSSGTTADYGYGSSAEDVAPGWDHNKSKAAVSERAGYKSSNETAPRVFDYGHQDCPPESAEVWDEASGYYRSTQKSSGAWVAESDEQQTAWQDSAYGGSAAYSTDLGSNQGYSHNTGSQRYDAAVSSKISVPSSMRDQNYETYGGATRDAKSLQGYGKSYDSHSDEAYSGKTVTGSSKSNYRSTQSSSDRNWHEERSYTGAMGSRYGALDSQTGGGTASRKVTAASSDSTYWTAAASYSMVSQKSA